MFEAIAWTAATGSNVFAGGEKQADATANLLSSERLEIAYGGGGRRGCSEDLGSGGAVGAETLMRRLGARE